MRRQQRRKLHKFYLNQQRRAENALDTDQLVFGPKADYYRMWARLNRAVARRIDLEGHSCATAFYEMEETFRQKAAAYQAKTQ